jgi:hypothetical protein
MQEAIPPAKGEADTVAAKAAASLIKSKQVKELCAEDKPVEPVTPTPEPTETTAPPVTPPVEPEVPSVPVRADSFKTWAESPDAARNFVFGSIFFALPVFLSGRALAWLAHRRKQVGKTN